MPPSTPKSSPWDTPIRIPLPSPNPLTIPSKLTPLAFSPFGSVIQNPNSASSWSTSTSPQSAPIPITANQNTALKYANISPMEDLYSKSPSQIPSKAVMNLFTCQTRKLEEMELDLERELGKRKTERNARETYKAFRLTILERHPFTTQTFIPLSNPQNLTFQYLVIVARSLPQETSSRTLPDLNSIRAFIAQTSQAITYAPGTWHSPMVVLGPLGPPGSPASPKLQSSDTSLDFVVVQFANGIQTEDCQEVVFGIDDGGGKEGDLERSAVFVSVGLEAWPGGF